MRALSPALCALALSVHATAQTAWLVGPAWDPVNQFHSLQAALDAASPGDVVSVDPRLPTSPATTDKGLTLVERRYVLLAFRNPVDVTVQNLPAGQRFVMRDFRHVEDFAARNCTGSVHLQYVYVPAHERGDGHGFEFTDCRLVTINGASLWNVTATRSAIACTFTDMRGTETVPLSASATPALTMIDATIDLGSGLIEGADLSSPAPVPVVPTIRMQGGRLRMFAELNLVGEGIYPGAYTIVNASIFGFSPAIDSNGGEVVLDPDVRVAGDQVGTSVFVRTELARAISGAELSQGRDLFAAVQAAPNTAVVMALGLPSPPLPTPFGNLWLDPRPGLIVGLGLGTTDGNGYFGVESDLGAAWPTGTTPMLQAVLVSGGRLELSLPVCPVVRR